MLADHDLDQLPIVAVTERGAPAPQQPRCVMAGAAAQSHVLLNDLTLLLLRRLPVARGHLTGDRLLLLHGEPHLL